MKFQVQQAQLKPLLIRCQDVADKKSTMPILGNVRITANGKVTLEATDLYQAVHTSVIEAKIQETGSVAVDARDLAKRVDVLTGDITFTLNGSTLTLKSGSRRFSVQTVPGEEFPNLPERTSATPLLTMSGDTLLSLINRVRFAVSTDETRAHLNSMLFEGDGTRITVAATDGHRLSVARTIHETPAFSILVPLKGLNHLAKLCADAGELDVSLSLHAFTLFIETPTYQGSVKLHDTTQITFPPYAQVIPSSSTGTTIVSRLGLLSAVKAVAVAASDKTNGIKLSFGGDTIRLHTESPDTGESDDEVSCKHEGAAIDVGVNAQYLLDELAAIQGDDVEIGTAGELDPTTLKALGDESGSVIVQMPMRL